MNPAIMKALLQREFLEGKFFYVWLPIILLGIVTLFVFMALTGIGKVGGGEVVITGAAGLAQGLNLLVEKHGDDAPLAVAVAYQMITALPWLSVPFIIFFSLIGSFYDERRDRSVLFWKSMPVSDTEEVIAKLVGVVILAPLIVLGVTILWQLGFAALFSLVSLVFGGPVGVLWPLGALIDIWLSVVMMLILTSLWALPVLAWLLLVSAYAPRAPFVYATLPIGLLITLENWLFSTHGIAKWLGLHMGFGAMRSLGLEGRHINGPDELLAEVNFLNMLEAFGRSLADPNFWVGLVVAGGLLYGAVELRRRTN